MSDAPLVVDMHKALVTTRTKVVLFAIHIAVAVAQFILSVAAQETFDFRATVAFVMRTGPVDASLTPSLTVDLLTRTLSVPYLFAAANLFAGIGLLVCLFYADNELDYIATGRMPYVWLCTYLASVPLRLAVELTSGIGDILHLLTLFAVTTLTFFIYFLVTYVHVFGVESVFVRTFFGLVTVLAMSIYDVSIIAAMAEKNSSGGPAMHLLAPISFVGLDVIAVCFIATSLIVWFKPQTILLCAYIAFSLEVLIISWLGFVGFAIDGITYP